MAITVFPSPEKTGLNQDATVTTNTALLQSSSKAWTIEKLKSKYVQTNKKIGREDRKVLQSSFDYGLGGNPIIPYGNGFVDGVVRAFNQDLHLVLRPDDIWLAILTQFSMYVNGHAEELRPFFVEHQGKKQLNVDFRPLSLFEADMGNVAHAMTKEIQKNVTDAELQKWMIPTFSTTTSTDVAVASFVMMGSLQKYFEYIAMGGCGFPSVTLLGEKDDWEAIADRVERLHRYGKETKEWGRHLTPILRAMVRTFDDPHSKKTKNFWLCACYKAGQNGSGGIATLSGWITAFCFWDEKGHRNGAYSRAELEQAAGWSELPVSERKPLELDGVEYPMFDPESLPKAFVTVPMTLEDHATQTKYTTTVVAGHIGMTLTNGNTVQPRSGWWMLEDSSEAMNPEVESGGEALSETSLDPQGSNTTDCPHSLF
jgi:hypothetical protein